MVKSHQATIYLTALDYNEQTGVNKILFFISNALVLKYQILSWIFLQYSLWTYFLIKLAIIGHFEEKHKS